MNHKIFGLSKVPTETVPNPWLFNWAMQTDGYSIIVDIKRNKGDGNPKKSKVKKKKEVWLVYLNKQDAQDNNEESSDEDDDNCGETTELQGIFFLFTSKRSKMMISPLKNRRLKSRLPPKDAAVDKETLMMFMCMTFQLRNWKV